MTTNELLVEREKTHGSFGCTATIAQATKRIWHMQMGWDNLTDVQRESLDSIATKVSRILAGNPADPDHWQDIQGYAKLGGG